MRTLISNRAPASERQTFVAHLIATEVRNVYRRTGDSACTREELWWRYAEIVPEAEQVWLDESLYIQFVDRVIASTDSVHDGGADIQFPDGGVSLRM